MDFVLGYLAGMIVMLGIVISFKPQQKREMEKLKDFENWKKWKNQK